MSLKQVVKRRRKKVRLVWKKKGGAIFEDDAGNQCQLWFDGKRLRIQSESGLLVIEDALLADELAGVLNSYAGSIRNETVKDWPFFQHWN